MMVIPKTQSLRGEPVDVRRLVVAAAVAGQIGIAEIIGHDEDDVRRSCLTCYGGTGK